MDKKYLKYLKGKNVVLVGPAQYLSDLCLGRSIDAHDVVVRVNRGMELIDKYPDSLGRRTDILYNCLIESLDNGGKIDVNFYKEQGVKWISTIPGSESTGECTSSKLHKMVKASSVKKIQKNFDYHVMNYKKYAELNNAVKCRANTGFAAIFDLLNQDIGSLYICGFSFYLDSFISGYKDGCKRNDDVFAEQCFVSKRHNQSNQWTYLKKIYKDDRRINCDNVLEFILNMENLSRDEFRESNIYTN